ncbi:MAG: aminotransferase class I/II-fold pyridoxal phosphate-dependent enzyme [Candidatus Hodarchaeota archaeon]
MTKRDPLGFMKVEYQEKVDQQLDWVHRNLQGPSDVRCIVEGKKVLMFCSNNYLGLSNHPVLKEAAIKAVKSHGAGSGSVRPIAGNMDLHEQWEATLARFKKTEAGFITSAGFTANEGVIPQLAPKAEDAILSDELNHGSIIDGVRLSKAKRYVYKHQDMPDLERAIKDIEKTNPRRILVITDGVFSMDGDYAKLDEIYNIVEPYGAMIFIDDAHGDGVLGNDFSGRGLVDHFSMQKQMHECGIEMGTFSKAFGTMGGSVVGSQNLVNWCRNFTRSYLLSGSHPPATAGASIAALDLLDKDNSLVKQLWENIDYFKKRVIDMGFNHELTINSQTAITPIIFGENELAKKASNRLYDEGIFALPIVFPMVPRGTARIRTMMNAALKKEDLDFALEKFEMIGKELKIF